MGDNTNMRFIPLPLFVLPVLFFSCWTMKDGVGEQYIDTVDLSMTVSNRSGL
jgi:hypothetical protein